MAIKWTEYRGDYFTEASGFFRDPLLEQYCGTRGLARHANGTLWCLTMDLVHCAMDVQREAFTFDEFWARYGNSRVYRTSWNAGSAARQRFVRKHLAMLQNINIISVVNDRIVVSESELTRLGWFRFPADDPNQHPVH